MTQRNWPVRIISGWIWIYGTQSYCFTSSLRNFCWLIQMDDSCRLLVLNGERKKRSRISNFRLFRLANKHSHKHTTVATKKKKRRAWRVFSTIIRFKWGDRDRKRALVSLWVGNKLTVRRLQRYTLGRRRRFEFNRCHLRSGHLNRIRIHAHTRAMYIQSNRLTKIHTFNGLTEI